MAQTANQTRDALISSFNDLVPTLDLSEGSVERDVLVEAPLAGGLFPLWKQIAILEAFQQIYQNPENVPIDTVNAFALNNFKTTRIPSTAATDIGTFFTDTFTNSITIPAGAIIESRDATPIQYTVIQTQAFSNLDAPLFFNALTNRYEFQINIQSVNTGRGTGVGKGTLQTLRTLIPGITGVTNNNSIPDGQDQETNTQLLNRITQKLVGKTIDTRSGLDSFLSEFNNDHKLLTFRDEQFKRSKFPGGVDAYFPVREPVVTSASFTVTTPNFQKGFIFPQQPAIEIQSVVGDVSGALSTTKYSLVKDTGVLQNSTKSADGIVFLSPGINEKVVTVKYTFNAFLSQIQTALDTPTTRTFDQDILVREANQVLISVSMEIRLVAGFDLATVSSNIVSTLNQFLNSLRLGDDVLTIDLQNLARVTGVASIKTSTFVITPSGGGSVDTEGNVILSDFEYAQANVITVNTF